MGSVPHLYTTGDNDPEIEPVQFYRHYLYCDACGSFELDSWLEAEHPAALEKQRRRLALAAAFSLPLVLVPVLEMLGFSLLFATVLAAGLVFFALFKGWDAEWSWLKWILIYLPFVAAAEVLVVMFYPPWGVLGFGSILLLGLLATRRVLGARLESRGLRCRACGATYAYGTPLFTQLDDNRRELTLDQVPRPLGVSPFETGRHVGPAPAETADQLPR